MCDIKFEFMEAALELARKAYDEGEVPVGAVIVKDKTDVKNQKMPFFTQRSTQLTLLAAVLADGGCGTVRFTLHLSPAQCARVQL